MTVQDRYNSLTPEQRALLTRYPQWRTQVETGEDLDILLRSLEKPSEGQGTAPEIETYSVPSITGTPEPISRPRAVTGPQKPFRGIPEMAPDDESEPEGLWNGPEEGPVTSPAQKDGTGRSLLRTLAQPFQGPEGKMRLLELLAGAGQGLLAGRAQEKAQRKTASSQARANLVGALSRRGGGQGVQYQPTQGIGQTLLGTLAGAGRMGQEAIQQERDLARQARGEAREDTRLGIEGERLGLEKTGQAATIEHQGKTEDFESQRIGLEKQRIQLEDQRARTNDARSQAMLDKQIAALDEQIRHNKETEGIARDRLAQGGRGGSATEKAKLQSAQYQQQINVLEDFYNQAYKNTIGSGSLVAAPFTVGGIQRLAPDNMTYNSIRNGVALSITTKLQGARPSDTDRAVVAEMAPAITDPPEVAAGKLRALRALGDFGEAMAAQGMVIEKGLLRAALKPGPDGTLVIDPEKARAVAVPMDAKDREAMGMGPESVPVEEVAKQDWLAE